jgi:hypothetical protein
MGAYKRCKGRKINCMQQWTEVKQRQRTMSLPEKIKTVAEMKNLQAEEKVVQAQKMARQAQLEPLQEKAEQLVVEIDAAKVSIEQIGLEGGEILRPPVTAQVVEAMTEKRNQAQEQCQWITEMYEALAQEVKDVGVCE